MKWIKLFDSYYPRLDHIEKSKLEQLIKSSKDWELMKETGELIDGSEYNYLYKNSPSGYKFIISKRGNSIILYLFKDNLEFVGFMGYADTPINRYQSIFYGRYGVLDGIVHFMNLNCEVSKFFNISLPSEEDIEDWFIYLPDAGFNITEIQYGFIDTDSESNVYNMIDVGSGNPSIVFKMEGDINLNNVIIDTYESHHDDETFIKNNPEFISAIKSAINRNSFYLGNMLKNYDGYKIYITSWGLVMLVIEFRFTNDVNKLL